MTNYADIEKIENLLVHGIDECGDAIVSLRDVRRAIAQAKNADVQEVMHGRWHTIRETTDSKTTECTACMKSFFFMRKGQLNIDLMPYCPCCGAKMDGKD